MNTRILKGILLLISIALAVLLIVLHLYFFITTKHTRLFGNAYQIIFYQGVFAAFILATALYIREVFAKIERLDVITMLWRLFIIGMVGITIMLAMLMLMRVMKFNSSTIRILAPVFFIGSIYALLIFFLSAVFIFRRFILYQKNRRKWISWNLFKGFMILTLLFTIRELVKIPFGNDTASLVTLETVITILFAALLLFLSTSVSWTAYLNFNQKLKALGLFALVIVVSVTYIMALRQLPAELVVSGLPDSFLDDYLVMKFINYIAAFTLTYSSVSILVLFFNLPTSSIFELKSSEIANFHKINQAIQGNLDFDEIMGTLLDASMLSANAQAGWILLFGEEVKIKDRKGISEEEIDRIIGADDIVEKVKSEKILFQIKNLKRHRGFKKMDTRYKAMVTLPILVKNEVYGLLFVMNEVSNSFEDVTLSSLASFAEQAGTAIENANLIKNAISLERYQEQLKIAKEVQKQLLPNALPESDKIEFEVISETADEVGGDYFDIHEESEDVFRVAIGDVSGKGTTAAFYMAEVKGIFHALSLTGVNPESFVSYANAAIAKCFQKGFFFTLTYLHIDLAKREFNMIRAGHCPTFFYKKSADSITLHREGTLGLGLVRDASFKNYVKKSESIPFETGDFVVLYTDGIIEARNQEDEEYGYDRFQEVLEAHKDESPKAIGAAVMDSVHAFAGQDIHDDYTVLIIRFL